MVIRTNVAISAISWIKNSYNSKCSGMIRHYYEPENLDELISLCRNLYLSSESFDVIGSTSNIYFRPNYTVDNIVSTHKINKWKVCDDYIYSECGTTVKLLSRKMTLQGFSGFEGLVDLPGTIGGSIYGNASCYRCSIGALLLEVNVLTSNGEIVTFNEKELCLSHRSSIFKKKVINGVILAAKLRKSIGNKDILLKLAENNHENRLKYQPGPCNNLGSVFATGEATLRLRIVSAIGYLFSQVLNLMGLNKNSRERRMKLQLFLLGYYDLHPYVWEWNRYIWKDENAHVLFDRYVEMYRKCFNNSHLEIEIKE